MDCQGRSGWAGGWFVLGAWSGPGWGGGLAGWVKGCRPASCWPGWEWFGLLALPHPSFPKLPHFHLAPPRDDVEHLHLLHPAHFQHPHPLGA